MEEGKSIKKLIPTIYQKQWLDVAIWGMIIGMRDQSEKLTVERAAIRIQQIFSVSEEQLPMSTIKTCYHRMQNEYRQHLKAHKKSPLSLNQKK